MFHVEHHWGPTQSSISMSGSRETDASQAGAAGAPASSSPG